MEPGYTAPTTQPTYSMPTLDQGHLRLLAEDRLAGEVGRSLGVNHQSTTPYSDATQVTTLSSLLFSDFGT